MSNARRAGFSGVGVYLKFCVNGKMQCKTERKLFKAGAATAAAALSTE